MPNTYDPFTRADSASLGSTPEGYAWSEVNTAPVTGQHSISSNTMQHVDNVDACALINVTDTHQRIWSVLGAADNTGLIACSDSTAENGWFCFEYSAGATGALYAVVAGVFTQQGATTAGFTTGDKMEIDAPTGGPVRFLKNGSEIRSTTDTSVPRGTYCGPYSGSVNGRQYTDFDATFGSFVRPTILFPRQAVARAGRW